MNKVQEAKIKHNQLQIDEIYELALQQATAQWSENYFIGVEAA